MGTSTMEPVLLTISPSWISLFVAKEAVIGAFCYLPIVTEDDNTDVVRLQVQRHAFNAGLEFHHLTSLDLSQTEHSRNTITDGDDRTEFLQVVLYEKSKVILCKRASATPPLEGGAPPI